MLRSLLVCAAVLAIELAAAPPAYACRCLMPQSACDAYGDAAIVFTGRVTSTDGSLMVRGVRATRVEFAVVEPFRGVSTPTLIVADSAGDCAVHFKVGETYFVYAFKEAGAEVPSTHMCSRTAPLARAQEDLTYARAISGVPDGTPGVLRGSVRRLDPGRKAGLGGVPVPGATVVATGPGGSFRAKSGVSGEFVLAKLPPGRYLVRTTALPKGLASNQPVHVDVWDPKGCGMTVLWARSRRSR